MSDSELAGTVEAMWRFPVKSMRGELIDEVQVTARGLVGDRVYALVDIETGKVVSAKTVRRFPRILECSAAFIEPPRADTDLPAVQITLPNGTTVSSDGKDVDGKLSAFFGHEVQLTRSAPGDFAIDQYHPDIEDVDPRGHRDKVVEQKLGATLFAELGIPPAVEEGSFFDLFPISLLTTATLARLQELQPESRFDPRRFRMNIIVDSPHVGFVENEWIDRRVEIGDDVSLQVALPDPRCVMTTLAQDDLPKDLDILRVLVRHNRREIGADGSFPCAGVYAVVGGEGIVKNGDRVAVR
jgi:uncharacterized protein